MAPQGELRENVVTGGWVVVAPARGDRPVEWSDTEAETRPAASETCPFCPGNEAELPGVLWELPDDDRDGWRTRAVPNRYPAFSGASAEGRDRTVELAGEAPVTPGRAVPAVGAQEVLIETPRHDVDLADMPAAHAEAVLRTYQARYELHARRDRPFHVALFRNEGREAGTSLVHAHAQLVATAARPPAAARREERLRAYHGEEDGCLLCALPDVEPEGGERTVHDGAHVRAFVPWAAGAPLEVWLVPRRHASSFADATAGERQEMAALLVSLARAYRGRAGDPDFNLLLHSSSDGGGDPALHWFVQLRPRVGRAAGFELLTEITINPSDPLSDAELIRDALGDVPAKPKETPT